MTPYIGAPTGGITAAGSRFAYREVGSRGGTPLVVLNHWGAVLDNFDPRIFDGLPTRHHVIAVNYRGIGASGGSTSLSINVTARDAIALIRALGHSTVDLMGFSLGGKVAQDLVLKAPDFVRKLILTGTDPACLPAPVESDPGLGPPVAAGPDLHPHSGSGRRWRD